MKIVAVRPTREEMMKRVARFSELKGSDLGLPDSEMPGNYKKIFNVLGFRTPADSLSAGVSPVGDSEDMRPAINVAEGFGVAFIKGIPDNGPVMHYHDTNETFISLSGKWRCAWEGDSGGECIDLEQYDTISFPAGVARRFICRDVSPGDDHALLLAIVSGDQPVAVPTKQEADNLRAAGLVDAAFVASIDVTE